MKSLRNSAAPLALTVSAVLCLCASAFAQAGQGTATVSSGAVASHHESENEAIAQVDGVTSAVGDQIFAATDHYWHHGDYYRIVALNRVCVEIDPTWVDAYSNSVWLLWSMGDNLAADRFLEYGVQQRPHMPQLQYELGWHFYNTKRYSAALPHLQAAAASPVATAIVLKTLAHCYARAGKTAESVATWQTEVNRFPGDPAGPHNLQEMQAKLRAEQAGAGKQAPKTAAP
jgi:Tfp pilus assembly protein PilF